MFHPRELSSRPAGEGNIFGLGLGSQASTHRSKEALRNRPKEQVPKVTAGFQRGDGMGGCGKGIHLWASS